VSPWATIESDSEGETLRIHTLISDSLTKFPPVAAAYRICIAAECIASTTDAFAERRVVKQSLIHPYRLTRISWWILQSSFQNYNRHQINTNTSHGRSGTGGEIMTCDGVEKRKEAKESEANHGRGRPAGVVPASFPSASLRPLTCCPSPSRDHSLEYDT
jgi:hypothetical protein